MWCRLEVEGMRGARVGKCWRRRGLVTVGVGGGERRAGEVVDVAWRGDGGAVGGIVAVGRGL